MLRIGQFTDTFLPVVDGVGRVAVAYAETLCKMGHQVTVVSPMYDTGYRGGYPYELVDFQGMTVPGNKQYRTGEATWDSHYRERMRMVQLDIAHAHSPFTAGSEALRAAVRRKIPLVGTFHSKYYDDFLKATKSEKMARLGVKVVVDFYRRCDDVWAVGKNTADVLHSYGYDGDIQVMPNGVNIRQFNPDYIREARRRFEVAENVPVLLFVGQINWKKNIRRVLEACALLKKQGRSFRLLLAGQGPDAAEIQHTIESMDLTGCARLIGHQTDVHILDGLYCLASLFVFPSLYDNAPMVVREAAAMGTPSVMVRGSSAAEIIRDRENGYLCEDDPADLARVLTEALADDEARRRVGKAAQDTIPVPWDEVLKTAVSRYGYLIDMNKMGELKKKYIRLV